MYRDTKSSKKTKIIWPLLWTYQRTQFDIHMSNAHTHVSTCTFTCPQSPLHVITQSCHRIAWHIDDYGWFCVSYLYLPYHALSEMWTPLDDWDDFTPHDWGNADWPLLVTVAEWDNMPPSHLDSGSWDVTTCTGYAHCKNGWLLRQPAGVSSLEQSCMFMETLFPWAGSLNHYIL